MHQKESGKTNHTIFRQQFFGGDDRGRATKAVREAPDTIIGLNKAATVIKREASKSKPYSVIATMSQESGEATSKKISGMYSSFNEKWAGAGLLTAAKSYEYTLGKQELQEKVAPLKKQYATEKTRAMVVQAKQKGIAEDVGIASVLFETKKEEAIPKIAVTEAEQIEKSSVFGARLTIEKGISSTDEILVSTGKGVVAGMGYGLIASGAGFAPWTIPAVIGAGLMGGVATLGYETGSTIISSVFKAGIPEGSERERKYLTAKPIPLFDLSKSPTYGFYEKTGLPSPHTLGGKLLAGGLSSGIIGAQSAFAAGAKNAPTTVEFVEAGLRGKDTYKDYTLFDPSMGVSGAQIGVGLLGSAGAVMGAAHIAAVGAPKLAALRHSYQVTAKLGGELSLDKNIKLIKGKTQANIKVTHKGNVVSEQRFSIIKDEQFKAHLGTVGKVPLGGRVGEGGSISGSKVVISTPGETPKSSFQYDLSHYKFAEGKDVTHTLTKTYSVGGGSLRTTRVHFDTHEILPNKYFVQAHGITTPLSPFKPP